MLVAGETSVGEESAAGVRLCPFVILHPVAPRIEMERVDSVFRGIGDVVVRAEVVGVDVKEGVGTGNCECRRYHYERIADVGAVKTIGRETIYNSVTHFSDSLSDAKIRFLFIVSELFDTDDKLADVNSYDASVMEKTNS